MYNFLKDIFGIPSTDQRDIRMDNEPPGEFRNNSNPDYDDDDDHVRMHPEEHMGFGFPIFSDPIQLHKYFESLVDEMHKAFNFNNHFRVTWEDETGPSGPFSEEPPVREPSSLRDWYLKSPGYVNDSDNKKEDVILDGKVKVNDIESLIPKEPRTFEDSHSSVQFSQPKIYSKSVIIKTVRHPDGTVETIKKVQDHTGKEETTVTHNYVKDENVPDERRIVLNDDASGISIFKKFFPF